MVYYLPPNLVALRKKYEFTQSDLGEKMDVTKQTISSWETGATTPDIKEIQMLAEIYKVSLDYIVAKDLSIPEVINMVFEPTVDYELSYKAFDRADIRGGLVKMREDIIKMEAMLLERLAQLEQKLS